MAVSATLTFNGLSAASAYVRLARIYGGRSEAAWRGIFQMYASEVVAYPDGRSGNPLPAGPVLSEFTISVVHQNGDPAPLLFAGLKSALPGMFSASNIADA